MVKVIEDMTDVLADYRSKACTMTDDELITRIIELHEQSKPKPEPVVWVVWNGWKPVGVTLNEEKAVTYAQSKQQHSDLSGDFNAYRVAPLYTTPPTREPLTKHERFEIITQWDDETGLEELVLRVERAHGIGVTNA